MTAALTPFEKTIRAQRNAAAPDSSAWVSANAGSGKTRVLTDRVIRLMLAGSEPGRILSITFTKAAAAEMSNRLFLRLSEWATEPDEKLREHLSELLDAEAEKVELPEARRLFARALETPGGLKIQTIHAFSESVLRRFPLEAGLTPEFGVLDDTAAAELLYEIRHRLVAGEGVPDAVAEALDRLLGHMADGSFDELLQSAIHERGLIRDALLRHGGVEGVAAALRPLFGLGANDTPEKVRAHGVAHGAWNEIGLRRVVGALREAGNKTALETADVLSGWIGSDDAGRAEMLADYMAVFVKKTDGGPKKLSTIYPKGAQKADPAGESVVADEQVRILELADRIRAADLIARTADLLTIADWLLTAFADAKHRRALLDFDDQIETTLALLKSSAAWVHFKLDQGIDHILIDEAQDTSPAQWEIAERLSAEFFAGDGARERLRTVFAVGDEKQSIYSFQGADPQGFDRMRHHFNDRAGEIGSGFRDLKLELSFRSAPEILRGVDAVFAGPAGKGLTASGEPVAHDARRESAHGLIEVWPLEEPTETSDPDRWRAPMDVDDATSPRRRLAQSIAVRIRDMIANGECVDGDDGAPRPVRPRDIMILVRRRDTLVEEIARALKAPEIAVPVAGSDRMKLVSQIAVMDLMALGEFLLMPRDDLTLATVLKSPFYCLDDDDLFALAWQRGRDVSLWQRLRERADENARWRTAVDELSRLMAEVDQTSPFAFYSAFLSGRGGRRRLYRRLGADQMDPLDEFLNAALADERDHATSLQGFLHRLRSGETEIKRDMEQGLDAVRIMTVHGAKGLEAPVVFLPDTTRPPRAASGGLRRIDTAGGSLPVLGASRQQSPDRLVQQMEHDQEASLAEYNRLLYVAMTRARDRLYVCGYYNSERARPADEGWYNSVRNALEPLAAEDAEGRLRLGGAPEPSDDASNADSAASEPPAWLTAPPPEEPAPPRPLAPSRTEDDAPPVTGPLMQGAGSSRRRGVLIHRLLEILPGLEPEVRRDAAARLLSRQPPDLDETARQALIDEALSVIEAPEMAPAFAPGSRAEAAVAGLVGDLVISGQVDRLALHDGQVWIVDYKTNRPPPAQPDQTPLVYLRQMALYREVLRQIHPGKPIVCGLVWTYETRLMVLPDTLLDHALASLDLGNGAT